MLHRFYHADLVSFLTSSGAALQLLLRKIFGAKFRIFTLAHHIESKFTPPPLIEQSVFQWGNLFKDSSLAYFVKLLWKLYRGWIKKDFFINTFLTYLKKIKEHLKENYKLDQCPLPVLTIYTPPPSCYSLVVEYKLKIQCKL